MKCFECDIEMKKVENVLLLTNPPQELYICPKCKSSASKLVEEKIKK